MKGSPTRATRVARRGVDSAVYGPQSKVTQTGLQEACVQEQPWPSRVGGSLQIPQSSVFPRPHQASMKGGSKRAAGADSGMTVRDIADPPQSSATPGRAAGRPARLPLRRCTIPRSRAAQSRAIVGSTRPNAPATPALNEGQSLRRSCRYITLLPVRTYDDGGPRVTPSLATRPGRTRRSGALPEPKVPTGNRTSARTPC